jgi:hypothetical protein
MIRCFLCIHCTRQLEDEGGMLLLSLIVDAVTFYGCRSSAGVPLDVRNCSSAAASLLERQKSVSSLGQMQYFAGMGYRAFH